MQGSFLQRSLLLSSFVLSCYGLKVLRDNRQRLSHLIDVCFDFPLFHVAVALNTHKTKH